MVVQWTAEQLGVLFPAAAAQMRGPLASLGLAMKDAVPDEEREQSPERDLKAARMDQSYYALVRFVENLSNMGWLMGTRKPSLENCDVADLVSSICVESAAYIEEQGRTLTFSVPPAELSVVADPEAMRTAIYQLLSNALKFTPAGGRIQVKLDIKGKRFHLSVRNTGEGLSEEIVDFLRNRCENPDRMDPPPHGLGLGLPLCRAIAEAHGGQILVQTKPGVGCQVTLSIPIRKVDDSAAVRECVPVVYDGGFSRPLLGLADALPASAFRYRGKT